MQSSGVRSVPARSWRLIREDGSSLIRTSRAQGGKKKTAKRRKITKKNKKKYPTHSYKHEKKGPAQNKHKKTKKKKNGAQP
jgi:hypothetical protein